MVRTGLEVATWQGQESLRRLRLGLIVNASSVTSRLQHTVTVLGETGFTIAALFAPEHGLWGASQDQIKEDGFLDRRTGLKVFSLYGRHKKPTRAMLKDVDAVVFDVQDIGTRFYTFVWTMTLAMESCAAHDRRFVVLDRPNPLNGRDLEGPVLEPAFRSFVGLHPIPIRHGLTAGELALFIKAKYLPRLDLAVIKMQGWRRSMWFDQTGLPWVMPSPNMPSLDTATVYPGMCLLEGTNISEGRGTTRPFEIFGAPWIDPDEIETALRQYRLAGVDFRPIFFRPTFHKFKGQVCGGLQLHITDRARFKPVLTAVAVLCAIRQGYPKKFAWLGPPYEDERRRRPFDILAGNAVLRRDIEKLTPLPAIERRWQAELGAFKKEAKRRLLYS